MNVIQKAINWFNNLYDTEPEQRSGVGPTTLKSPATWLMDFFGVSGDEITVTEESALRHAAVFSCVKVLSETMAMFPFNVYERNKDGSRSIATSHPNNYLINQEPNPLLSSFTFRETMQANLCLNGNAYALIHRNGGNRPVSFQLLTPSFVEPKIIKDKLWYKVSGVSQPVAAEDMIHIPAMAFDGITGKSPISAARENIQLGLAAQQFGYKFFKNGANVSGTLEVPEELTEEAAARMKSSWEAIYGGHGNNSKTAILEGGTKYNRIGIPPEDAQFLETRKFQINEIARIFRVPPHMIADLERATFSNIEHQSIDFVNHTMLPWVTRWEQEFNRKIFRKDERGRFYVKFNVNALLRGDATARGDFYTKLFQVGALSQNDIRKLEDQNAITDGDKYFVPLNMVPHDKYDEYLKNNNNGKTGNPE